MKWAVFLAVIGVLIAPVRYVPVSNKLITVAFAVVLLVLWLKGAFVRWIKSDDKAPYWDEIKSVPPIIPEPPVKASGPIGRAIGDFIAKRTLKWLGKNKDDPAYLNAMGEMFDTGTKHTPKNPVEAMRWYVAAVGGDPTQPKRGPEWARLRIAELYEDGEGVARDLDMAGCIYKTIPNYPSAMLHFAIAHVEGRGMPRDYVEAYRLLLVADKARSWHPSTRKEIEVNPQSHRANSRHIRVRELMAILEARMTPEQLLRAREAAREWWNAHR